MAYLTVAKEYERLEEVKGSKFYSFVAPLKTSGDIETYLETIKGRYPDASHHCYAYKFDEHVRFSDDGEPGGTAGRPMLEVLNKRGLERSIAVVTRYFGGVKLGAGGLVRAYSGSLAKAIDEAGTYLVKDRYKLSFEVPFAAMDSVHRLLGDWPELTKSEPSFTEQGMTLSVTLLEADIDRLKTELDSATRGDVRYVKAKV